LSVTQAPSFNLFNRQSKKRSQRLITLYGVNDLDGNSSVFCLSKKTPGGHMLREFFILFAMFLARHTALLASICRTRSSMRLE